MQTSTVEKPAALTRAAEIRELAKEAKRFHSEAEEASRQVDLASAHALEKAWQCGKRLNQIKALVGHGNWIPWLENNLPMISERSAQLYMSIDRDNAKAQRVADLQCDSVRKHAMRFVPDKPQPNKGKDVKFGRLVSFLNIVNEYNRLRYRHVNDLQRVDFEEALQETSELYAFLRWLHGDSAHNPWAEAKLSPPRR
jgi:hypothetical protein